MSIVYSSAFTASAPLRSAWHLRPQQLSGQVRGPRKHTCYNFTVRCTQKQWSLLSRNACPQILCDFQITQNTSCGQGRTYFLGAWSLETASHEGKSGLQQARRSSSRARAVSASVCSLYSSSLRYLSTSGSVVNHGLTFLKHMTSGCLIPVQFNPYDTQNCTSWLPTVLL